LTAEPPVPRQPLPYASIWLVAAAADSPHAALVSTDGRLYSLDIADPTAGLTALGDSGFLYPMLLACSDDGALVVTANYRGISLWDRQSRTMLWRRSDIGVRCAEFVPGSHRLVCGLPTGEVLELGATDGVTVREVARRPYGILSLDISPDGSRLAISDLDNRLTLIEQATGGTLWSQDSFRWVPPRFTHDGRSVLTSDMLAERIVVLDAQSGRPQYALEGERGVIKGVEVGPHGAVYSWHVDGTIAVWNLAQRRRIALLRPEHEPIDG
jgi:hypothetical protein